MLGDRAGDGLEAAWVRDISLERVDAVVDAKEYVDECLARGATYLEAPQLDARGAGVRAVLRLPSTGVRADDVDARVTIRSTYAAPFAPGFACSCGRLLCAHAMALFVDLALSPALREAVSARMPCDGVLPQLAAARAAALEARAMAALVTAWLPRASRVTEAMDLDFSVDVVGRVARERETHHVAPYVEVRLRARGGNNVLDPETLPTSALSPDDQALVSIGERHPGRRALTAYGVAASLLVHRLRGRCDVYTNAFKLPLTFADAPVAPRVDAQAEGGGARLVASWVSEDGRYAFPVGDAIVFRGPYACVWWPAGRTFFAIAEGVAPDFVAALEAKPELDVAPALVPRLGRALLEHRAGAGVALPPREAFGLAPIPTPRLVLRIDGDVLDVRASLEAHYGETRVRIDGGAPGGVDRDHALESAAMRAVLDAGLTYSPFVRSLTVSGEAAVDFWENGIVVLRASKAPAIDVLCAENLLATKVALLRPTIRIDLDGDWLAARFAFRADEVDVEMHIVREALEAKRKWLLLGDGTLARIHGEIGSFFDEMASVAPDGAARLPMHQIGRVDRWAEAHETTIDPRVDAFRAQLRALRVSADPELPAHLEGVLRPYQRQGVAWLQFLRKLGAGGILADDMGLGKTLMTLAFLMKRQETEGSAPSLLVCPTSLVGNWVREAERFTPGLRVVVLRGPNRAAKIGRLKSCGLAITTYPLLRRDAEMLARVPFRCVVLDEAQNIKNDGAATAKAARALDAEMRIALTGTPVENRLRELWSILSFCNPGILGSARDFEQRFERPILRDPRDPAGDVLRALVRPFILRRTKAQVLGDLPPKTEIERACLFDLEEKRMYDALAHTLRSEVEAHIMSVGLGKSGIQMFAALTRLRQMACEPRLVDANAKGPSAKREAFLELVRELVAEGRRALVFSQFVELLTLWRKDLDREGIRYEYLDGQTQDREAVIDAFQHGTAPLFLLSLKAGGAGLNLTAADTVIHIDPWWNPAVEDQATDRAHRIGQTRAVTVVRLVALGTIEDKIAQLKAKKREIAASVLDGREGALRGLTHADVRMLLGDADADAEE